MSIHKYDGDGFAITWDKATCIHAAECVHQLPSVFDVSKTPWVNPHGATPEAIEAQIRQCPSGALGFVRKDDRES